MFEPLIKLDDPMGDMQRYKKTGNLKIRNDLVLYYSYIPKAVAAKLKFVSCDASVIEDIINEGMIALMECIEKYDEARGVKFDTYAFFRVRGAALDFIRKQDFLPHRVRKKARDIEKAYNELANKNLREPTDEELAEFLGEDVLSVQKHYGEITNSVMLSFEEMLSEDFSSGDNGVKTAGKDSPEETAIAKELSEKLASIISALNEKEKTILALYYNEELKYKEIGTVLEISESRVCQIHSRLMLKLKKQLSEFIGG